MDVKSLRYIDLIMPLADTDRAHFVAAELKRLGFKPKTAHGSVYCDIGRSKTRTAFYAELADESQTSVVLSFAAALGKASVKGVRLIFDGNTDEELLPTDGAVELYSAVPCSDMPSDGLGCCYGVACAGTVKFSLKAVGGEWRDISADIERIADKNALSCVGSAGGQSYVLRYFDKAKCESALLDVERLMQSLDDEYGTEHMLTVSENYPPLKNDALCVDKVRYAGETVKLVRPSQCSYGVSRYLDDICGCAVFMGPNASSAVVRLFLRLVDTKGELQGE